MPRILFVDDEETIRKSCEFAFSLHDYDVVAVSSAKEAEGALKMNFFDAMILDVNMPEEKGSEFLERVRKSKNDIPVIVFSGAVGPEAEKALFELGANGVVDKALGVAALIRKVREVLKIK